MMGAAILAPVATAAEVGKFIREKRAELGLSQESLGKLVGVSKQSIANWEDGVHGIRSKYIQPLMKALQVREAGPFFVDDESGDLGASGTIHGETDDEPTAREVLYEFLDSDLAKSMSLQPREIGWAMDHHVSGAVTPEYFYHLLMMERSRLVSPPKTPSDRPNEATGEAARSGLKKRVALARQAVEAATRRTHPKRP